LVAYVAWVLRQSLFAGSGERDEGIARFEQNLQRLDDRVRRWLPARWSAQGAEGQPRTEVAYALALSLTQLARQAGNGAPAGPPPRLEPHGIADQLMVLGREFVAAPEAAALSEAATAAVVLAAKSL
jgi:hypothetical protein